MKHLILVRHAKSSWSQPGLSDHDRPLNDRGRRDAPRMATWLAAHVPRPDVAILSTARRVQETAAYFVEAFHLQSEQVVNTREVYEARVQDVLDQVGWIATPEMRTVMVIGHNPTLTLAVNQLAMPSLENLPTCGVAVIGFPDDQPWNALQHGTMVQLMVPGDMEQ